MTHPAETNATPEASELAHGEEPNKSPTRVRHQRAESPTWQAIERVGKRYLQTSKRVAQLLSALRDR